MSKSDYSEIDYECSDESNEFEIDSEYEFPKKLLIYMSLDERKIREMIDKQIEKFIKLYPKRDNFIIEYREKYPDKYEYVSKNIYKIYELLTLTESEQGQIYKNISELLQVDNPEYWYKSIKNSYIVSKNNIIRNLDYYIDFSNINYEYESKYKKYHEADVIPKEILAKYIIHINIMHDVDTIKYIIENPYSSKTINIFHNYNYVKILCKFFLYLSNNYHSDINSILDYCKLSYYCSTRKNEILIDSNENPFGIKVYKQYYLYSPYLHAPHTFHYRNVSKILYEDKNGFLENIRKIIFNN